MPIAAAYHERSRCSRGAGGGDGGGGGDDGGATGVRRGGVGGGCCGGGHRARRQRAGNALAEQAAELQAAGAIEMVFVGKKLGALQREERFGG